MNRDGSIDIIAVGPNGIDLYLMGDQQLSDIGFIPHNGDCPGWSPGSITVSLLENELGHVINQNVTANEYWMVVYHQANPNGYWSVNGEISLGQPNYDPVQGWQGTYCGIFDMIIDPGVYCSGDKFVFSTFHNTWSEDLGPTTSSSYTSLAVGDINIDGILDIIAAKASGGFDVYYYLESEGNYYWQSGVSPSFSGVISDHELKDINRDGRLDIVACSADTGIHAWKGQVNGTWGADFGPENQSDGFSSMVLGDYNKDGLIDVAATSSDKAIFVYYLRSNDDWFQRARAEIPKPDRDNIGDGSVSAVKVSNSATKTESWDLTCIQSSQDGGVFRVHGDKSGSQSQNAVVGQVYTSDNGEVVFTIYDGPVDFEVNDKFTFLTGTGPLSYLNYSDIDTADLDNDGNLDLFASNDSQQGLRVWRGNGIYGWTTETPPQDSNSWGCIAANKDLNFDGNPDVIAGSSLSGGIHVWIGDDIDKFTWTGWIYSPLATGRYAKVDTGDFNVDGKIDIVAANLESDRDGIWVWEGDNVGGFVNRDGPTRKSEYYSVATADFNRDGRTDIAGGHQSDGFDVWMAQNNWTWSASSSGVGTGNFWDLCAADINRDGYPDLCAARNYVDQGPSGVMIYLNDGDGNFDGSNVIDFPQTVYNYWGVESADFDQNGFPDLIATKNVGNVGIQVFWSGRYYETYTFGDQLDIYNPDGYDHYYGVTTADYNLDSRYDWVAGEDGHGMMAGYGYGGVALPQCMFSKYNLGYGQLRDKASMDLTNDGTPDLVAATKGAGIQAYRTNLTYPGVSNFSNISQPATDGDYIGVTIADLTGDGLPDLSLIHI